MNDYLSLTLGVLLAGLGGELFLAGLLGLATWARVPARLVATTIAAFATSSPELTIALSAALAAQPEISLGDSLGSNVVNVGLVLASAVLIARIPAPRAAVRRDFVAAISAPPLIGALSLDGVLSRLDGLLLLCAFLAWLQAVIREALHERRRSSAQPLPRRPLRAALSGFAGCAVLVLAGRLVVQAGHGIALRLDADLFVVGATLVALGTSMPELALGVIAQLRRTGEVGLGAILGSNVFNAFFIVGVAASICPIRVAWHEVALALAFGIATLAAVFPGPAQVIGRRRGLVLLALFVAYGASILSLS
jgi:cation:H+ antiporter